MDAATHARLVRGHLDAATPEAVRRLRAVVDALPDRAEEIVVTVFPDQDGEGTFDVVVSLDGHDAAVLDRAIAPHRTLFEVVHGEDGPVPGVPLVGPGRARTTRATSSSTPPPTGSWRCGTPQRAAGRACRAWWTGTTATAPPCRARSRHKRGSQATRGRRGRHPEAQPGGRARAGECESPGQGRPDRDLVTWEVSETLRP